MNIALLASRIIYIILHNPGYNGNSKYSEASSSRQGLENSLPNEFGLEGEKENINSQAEEEKKRSGMVCFSRIH